MNPCKIVQDLLPLYIDNSCTKDSQEYVEQHLAECAECRVLCEAMSRSVQVIITQQNAKKSFSDFQKRLLRGRILLIVLCALIALIPLSIWAYVHITDYLYDFTPAPIESIESTVSRLSDGSIYVCLKSADENVRLTSHFSYDHPYSENFYYIELGSMPSDFFYESRRNKGSEGFEFLITTSESYGKYQYGQWVGGAHYPYTRIVLSDSDNERILWQEGDPLPAADEKGESLLRQRIKSGHFIPIAAQADPS